jgi:hypothetical protein
MSAIQRFSKSARVPFEALWPAQPVASFAALPDVLTSRLTKPGGVLTF